MNDIQKAIIKTSLKHMFDKGWFDICAFRKCTDLAGVYPPTEIMKMLNPLHCVNFNQMEPQLRRWLVETCAATFSLESFDPSKEIDQLGEKKAGFFGRLLN